MERSKTGTKNRNPDGLSLPNNNKHNTIIINIMWYYFMRIRKSTAINKKQNRLEQSKN